ncbi:hypothetical protein MKX01_004534 [Papaver californicum]|nr:hypothetical protein MKX01_004534 [Papaver californicum]
MEPNQPSNLTSHDLNPRNHHRRQREPDANQSNRRRRIDETSANNNNNNSSSSSINRNQNQEWRHRVAIRPFGDHVQFDIDNEGRVRLEFNISTLHSFIVIDDTDSMGYEGLMELQERIGKVDRGLSQETISSHLKTRVHTTSADSTEEEEEETEICAICQDGYENKDNIGTLDCKHEYHEGCITRWLVKMNVCPICKRQALKTMEETRNK